MAINLFTQTRQEISFAPLQTSISLTKSGSTDQAEAEPGMKDTGLERTASKGPPG